MKKTFCRSRSPSGYLPIRRDLMPVYALSTVVAIVMTAASLGGLLFPVTIYPTDALRQSFMANDLVNLLIGLPILLGSMWLTRRGKLVGLLCWPGALLYVFYNYTVYVFGMPVGLITFAFVVPVLLSAYLLVTLLKYIDKNAVQAQLTGRVPEKLSGGVLVVFGMAFFFLAVGIITEARTNQTTLPTTDFGLAIADMIFSVFLVAGGVLLFQRNSLGYASGLGLLFAASMLFIGLILLLVLQPVLTDAPFALTDVIVVSLMGLVCFIPTGLFMRGVQSEGISS
jgi:hypothetical protein